MYELWKTKWNLQMFADDGADDGADPGTNDEENQEDGDKGTKQDNKGAKTYTQEEVDRIVTQRLTREKAKTKQEMDEAKKLANMDAQQKIEYERDKLQKELDELKKANTLNEMSTQTRKMLSDSGITVSDDLLSMMVSTDAEKTKKAVDSFVKLFNDHVEKEVKERLKGKAPKKGGSQTLTREQILNITDSMERQKKIAENIELFTKK